MKEDTRGRVRTPKARREELLDEFERSGLSGMRFASLAGIKYATFAFWVARRRKAREQSGSVEAGVGENGARRPLRLFEALLPAAGQGSGGAGLAIELPGGARLAADSPMQLQLAAELIRILCLGGRPC